MSESNGQKTAREFLLFCESTKLPDGTGGVQPTQANFDLFLSTIKESYPDYFKENPDPILTVDFYGGVYFRIRGQLTHDAATPAPPVEKIVEVEREFTPFEKEAIANQQSLQQMVKDNINRRESGRMSETDRENETARRVAETRKAIELIHETRDKLTARPTSETPTTTEDPIYDAIAALGDRKTITKEAATQWMYVTDNRIIRQIFFERPQIKAAVEAGLAGANG